MAILKRQTEASKKWSEQQMLRDLVGGEGSCFPFTRYLCVPNVSWGFLSYEADLLVVSPKGKLIEIEIKISKADLMKDIKKDKHKGWASPKNPVSQLYYAMPLHVYSEIRDAPPIPEYAGIITIADANRTSCHSYQRLAKKHEHARNLFIEEVAALSRLGVMRFWSALHKINKRPVIEIQCATCGEAHPSDNIPFNCENGDGE